MSVSKSAVVANAILGKLLGMIGYSVGVLSIIVVIVAYADMGSVGAYEALAFFLVVLVLCLFAVVKGAQIKRRVKRFRQYVSLISLQNMTALGDIAASTSRPVVFVKRDLQKMIGKRYFVNATIDLATDTIIICPGTLPVQAPAAAPPEYEVFQCSGCGATGKKQKGSLGYCDYCGAPTQ